jgi:hypothetical protein
VQDPVKVPGDFARIDVPQAWHLSQRKFAVCGVTPRSMFREALKKNGDL